MNEMPFKSGDTLLVEEDKSLAAPTPASSSSTAAPPSDSLGSLWKAQLDKVGFGAHGPGVKGFFFVPRWIKNGCFRFSGNLPEILHLIL